MKRASPRSFLIFCLLMLASLLAASCSSGSDSTDTDNSDTPSEASETTRTTRPLPFTDQTSENESTDSFPVLTEPRTPENKAIAIAAGDSHSCALHEDGTISCWGENWVGQLGNGQSGRNERSLVPVEVAGIADATAVAADWEHSCALHEDGTISCWGRNWAGQLGNGQSTGDLYDHIADSSVPVKVAGIADAAAITASGGSGWTYGHSCALHEDGTISCWGNNWVGQLGNGQSGRNELSSVPVGVADIADATAITTGDEHSCALHEDGTISCWGNNRAGQLGDGTEDDSSVPVRVSGITDATAITASTTSSGITGEGHSCALHEDGTISCWGNNSAGQLGDGTEDDSSVPVRVSGITDATAITASGAHSCALRQDGTISCWGNNRAGQLGNGTWDASSVPVGVVGITDAAAIAAGYEHSCALYEDGTISCWGAGSDDQLGDGVWLPRFVVGFGG